MKCPKCGYISFDFNQVCPKCNKNISTEQERFNLPSFRPEPPSLLGYLIGEANESNVNLRVSTGSRIEKASIEEIGLNDSVILDHDQIGIEDQDLDISFEPEEAEEDIFDVESADEPEMKISDTDFSLEEKDLDEAVTPSEAGEEDISLDLGDLSIEESGQPPDELESAGSEPTIAADDAGISMEGLDSLPVDIDGSLDGIESEIELDLDDLKVSDIGNLEIGPDMELSGNEQESTLVESEADTLGPILDLTDEAGDKLPDISELILKEAEVDQDKTLAFDDFSLDDSSSAEKEVELELGEMPIEGLDIGEEEPIDLDLNLGIKPTGEKEKTILLEDLDINDSSELEKSFDIGDLALDEDSTEAKTSPSSKESLLSDSDELDVDLDAMSLDVEEYQKGDDSGDDFSLDLEDMDIDLDLNEPKKKS